MGVDNHRVLYETQETVETRLNEAMKGKQENLRRLREKSPPRTRSPATREDMAYLRGTNSLTGLLALSLSHSFCLASQVWIGLVARPAWKKHRHAQNQAGFLCNALPCAAEHKGDGVVLAV